MKTEITVNTLRHRRHTWIVLVSTAAATLLAVRPLHAQQTGELKTVAVVAVARYEKLISDITFLGSLGGRPEMGQMVEGGFAFFTQGKGPQAIDKTQPLGVVVQTDGAAFYPVGCLPVTQPKDLLDVARGFGAEIKDKGKDIHEIQMPNQQRPLFVKLQGGWAFLSGSLEALDRAPENPPQVLGELVSEYVVGGRISVKDVPEMYRQFAITAMQAGMQQQLQQQQASESQEQYELRRELAEAQMEQMVRTINEMDSLTFGWAIDEKQQRMYADFTYLFVEGSKTAEQIATYEQPRTNFAGFYQPDVAMTMSFATKADPDVIRQDIQQVESMMQAAKSGFNQAVDESEAKNPEGLKEAFSEWVDAFAATVKAGEIDGAAALHLEADSLTLVAGGHVAEPAKVESGLKKLEEAAQDEPQFAGIQWNVDSHAGVKFHTMTIPVPEDQEGPRKLLGSEVQLAVGIGPSAVYVGAGKEHIAAVKRAIDASAAEPNKAVPPFELVVSLGPIMDFAAAQAEESEQREIVKSIANMLRNEAAGRDHLRMVGQILPNGLRYRVEAEEGVLKAIGRIATEAQRQALQANQ
jgi:hypothetical protein